MTRFRNKGLSLVLYSLRLGERLSETKSLKMNSHKNNTKSNKWYFDYEIKIKTKRNETIRQRVKLKQSQMFSYKYCNYIPSQILNYIKILKH